MAREDAVARIRQDQEEPEEEEILLDLDEMDDQLRKESVGKSMPVKINGKVVHFVHPGDWSSSAMRALTNADWDDWARDVIEDDKEYGQFLDADLRVYQLQALSAELARQARLSLGKSRQRSGSSRNGRKR